jgi:curved DNA-binding protein CbpA
MLVLKHHPDKDDSKESRYLFGKIQEAFAVIGNETKRAAYDRERNNPTRPPVEKYTGTQPSTTDKGEEWWENVDSIRDFSRKHFEAQAAKRRMFEAKTSPFRWPTGESFEQMDAHQRYFYYQMMRNRKYSTMSRFIVRRLF